MEEDQQRKGRKKEKKRKSCRRLRPEKDGRRKIRRQQVMDTAGQAEAQKEKAEMRSCIPLLTEPLFLAAAFYLLFSLNFIHTYLPNTIIRGISVSGLTAEEAKEKIAAQMGSYELVLEERGGRKEIIRGMDITLRPVYDGDLERIMDKQNPLLWGARYVKGEEYESAGFGVRYDEAKLEMVVRKLRCMDPEKAVPPADACLVYTDNEGLQIKKEEQGNYPVPGRLLQEARRAVDGLEAGYHLRSWTSTKSRKYWRMILCCWLKGRHMDHTRRYQSFISLGTVRKSWTAILSADGCSRIKAGG